MAIIESFLIMSSFSELFRSGKANEIFFSAIFFLVSYPAVWTYS